MPTPEELLADALEETPEASSGLMVLVERMVELKGMVAAAEEHLRELRQDYNVVRLRYLPEALADNGLTRAKTSYGTLSLRTKTHASIPKDRRAEALQWLLAHGLGDVLTVEPKALQELVTDLMEAGRTVPDFIRVFTEEMVVLTRTGAAKA